MNLQATQPRPTDGARSLSRDAASLLARLGRREPAAQEGLLRAQYQVLHSTAMSILGSKADATPLVSDVFTDFFYSYVDRVEHERAIPAYLRIMVVRRSRRLLQQRSQEDDIAEYDFADLEGREVIETLEAKTWLPWLEDCLSLLTERAHKILKLHFGHDLGTVEIAGQVGITKQAVSKTILKCIGQLRRCLEGKRGRAGREKP